MRTLKLDSDHDVSYNRTGRNVHEYTVRHRLTTRVLAEGAYTGDVAALKTEALRRLAQVAAERRDVSRAFAAGEISVPGVTIPGPKQAEIARTGSMEIGAGVPVAILRDAYSRALRGWSGGRDGMIRIEQKIVEIGRAVLIGATDEQILRIARGQATLEGSLSTGVRYVDSASAQPAASA